MLDNLVLTVEECAKELKVAPSDVMMLIKNNELCAKKIGTKYRITIFSLHDYLKISPIFMQSLLNSTIPNHNRIIKKTVNEVLDQILELKKINICNNTYEWLCGIANHIRNYFGNTYLHEISPDGVQEFYVFIGKIKGSKNDHLSKRMIIAIRGLINFLFKYSLEHKYIIENPIVSTLFLPKSCAPDPHKRFMDYNQINILLDLLKENDIYYTVTKLLVMSGLRIGEALGLYWEDIDLKENVIHVRHAIVRDYVYEGNLKKEIFRIGNPKTPQSIRDVPVVPQVVELIKAWKCYLKSNKKLFDKIINNKTQYLVFPNKSGKLQNVHTFRSNYRLYIKNRRGAYLEASFHRLRHSYGSFLLEQGEELITVSRLLGHKSIRVTADIYCTVTAKLKLKAVDKTINIWDNISNIPKNKNFSA